MHPTKASPAVRDSTRGPRRTIDDRQATKSAKRFVAAGGGFEVEYAGPVVRIWHEPCLNHDLLPDDDCVTVARWKAIHRCGARVSPWDRGDFGGRA